jgi:hypothetical protein
MADRNKLETFIAEIEADAYQRGVADTWAKFSGHVDDFISKIKQLQTKVGIPNFTASASPSPNDVDRFREPREGSDQARVLAAIRLGDGMRGIDIVNKLAGEVEARTVRTALFRLKTRKAIFQKEGKWYPTVPLFAKIEGQTSAGD